MKDGLIGLGIGFLINVSVLGTMIWRRRRKDRREFPSLYAKPSSSGGLTPYPGKGAYANPGALLLQTIADTTQGKSSGAEPRIP